MRSTVGEVFLNGKWLAQATTGTQRYAEEITKRLSSTQLHFTLVVPSDAPIPNWENVTVRQLPFKGLIFEQFALPWAARGGLLLNLSGGSPIIARRQIVTLFDASVFRYPKTFRRSFAYWYRFLYRTATRRARAAITISSFSNGELTAILKPPPGWLVSALCGADHLKGDETEVVSAPDLADAPDKYVLLIGSPTERKNLREVVPAFAEAGYRTLVVGVSDSRVFTDSRGIETWTSPRIELTGRLSDDEIVSLMREAVALIFPSRYEGFGLPIVEAQAIGCPVIAASTSSLPEVGGDAALYFEPDAPAVAVALAEALSRDPSLRRGVVQRGLANAARYRWQDAADVVTAACVRALRLS
ncbi:glycosyl transferase group 1 [Microbacterium laevaniformans OR221]|nr:glycosyl transferase group 1 [Microbacterium laevaniformans OR221]